MPKRNITLLLIPLLLASLACKAAAQAWEARPRLPVPVALVTPSPLPTFTPPPTRTPTLPPNTLTPTPSLTPVPPSPTPTFTPTPTLRPTASPEQLEVFEEIWQKVKDNYLYPDFNGLDWDKVHSEVRQKIEAGLSQDDFYLAMFDMIAGLGDDHSTYFSPEEAKLSDAQLAGDNNYVGIGVITALVAERKRVTIIVVFAGSPASDAGLQMHDSILEADGQPIVDENGFRRDLLRGPIGTPVTLVVQTPGEEPRQVRLIRRRIDSSYPVPYQVVTSPEGKRIGYILLPTFYDETVGDQVGEALHAMGDRERLDGIILDNRQNEGGADDVFGAVLGYFTQGTVGHFVNRQDKIPVTIQGRNVNNSQKIPLVVMVGKDTVSFGEIFSGVMKDLGRAYLIGETTEGNVEILYPYEFSDGSRIWLAHDVFRPARHPDQNWEDTGIIPDLQVTSNWDEVTTETDPAVLAALNHFDGKK